MFLQLCGHVCAQKMRNAPHGEEIAPTSRAKRLVPPHVPGAMWCRGAEVPGSVV